jgi:hypothetical protein
MSLRSPQGLGAKAPSRKVAPSVLRTFVLWREYAKHRGVHHALICPFSGRITTYTCLLVKELPNQVNHCKRVILEGNRGSNTPSTTPFIHVYTLVHPTP